MTRAAIRAAQRDQRASPAWHSLVLHYAPALATPVLAGTVAWAMRHELDSYPTSQFVLAVLVSALLGGLWPGLLAALLSALILVLAFIEPVGALRMNETGDLWRLALFLSTGVATSIIAHRLRLTRQRLHAESADFRAVFDHAAIGIARVAFTGERWIDVNNAFCRMLGYSRHEMLATPWTRMTHPDDLDRDLILFRQMAAGVLDSYVVEKRFLHRDGHDVWARLTLSLVRGRDGTPAYEIAIVEDIGSQHAAAAALVLHADEREQMLAAERVAHERTERLQSLTAALSAAITVRDVVRVVIDAGLDALGADAGLVALLDTSDNSSLRLVEARGYQREVPVAWHRITSDAPVPMAEAVRTGRTLVLRAAERRDRFPSVTAMLDRYAVTIAVPLRSHGRMIGALAVNRTKPGDLSPESLAFVEAFAQQCAHAIDRARLHEEAVEARLIAERAEQVRRTRELEARALADALGTEQAKLAAVIEHLPVGVGISTTEGQILALNRSGLDLHGFSSEAEMFAHLPQYVHEFELRYPDGGTIPVDDWPLSQALRGVYVRRMELQLYRKSTHMRYDVSYDVVPVRDASGELVSLAFVIQDLTESKRASAALTERTAIAERREAQLAAVLDRLPAAVWIADAEGRIEQVSAATALLYGAAPLLSSSLEYLEYEAYWPSTHRRAGQRLASDEWALARSLATGETVLNEALEIARFGGGERRQVLNSTAAIRGADGTITGGVAVMFDVTEQVATGEALEQARAEADAERRRLRLVLDRLPVGVIVVDSTGAVIHHNPALEQVLGHDVHRAEGVEDYQAYGGVHPDGRDYAPEEYPIARALLRRETVQQELTHYRRADGRVVMLSISAAPVFDDDGRLAHAVAAVEDVHERESARALAEQANAAKSQFLTTMSHELRTPLHAIAGHVQLVEMGIHGPVTPEQLEALGRVQRAQRHLLSLINDILNFARLDAGRVEYHIEPVALADVVADVLPLVEPMFASRQIAVTVEYSPRPSQAWADREKLGQVLLNLLSNAAKFTEPGGAVQIAVRSVSPQWPRTVHLHVTDTGVGIPEAKQEQIFEPFVQIARGLTSQHEGTGLGLSISRTLARAMGGDITVQSEPGAGSVFTLVLRATETVDGEPLDRRSRLVTPPVEGARRGSDGPAVREDRERNGS
jgi:PAS domain S-box-containing protein